jgi:hypothetical protein
VYINRLPKASDHFGDEAVRLQLDEARTLDDRALKALRDTNASDRIEVLLGWFYSYQVFQDLSAPQRAAVQLLYCNGLTEGT